MNKMYIKKYICLASIFALILITISIFYNIDLNKSKINEDDEILKNKTIVRVWMPKDAISDTREYQIKKFNETSKDIYIMYTTYDYRDYSNILKTSLAAEKGPDIMTYGFFELIKENKIQNLNYIKNVDKNDFVYYNGNPVGVRMNEQNVKLVWNKDILKKAGLNPNNQPKTWNQIVEYSEIIKKECPDVIPFAFPLKDYQDFKASIGEPSVNLGNIYTSFWNFKLAKYEFDNSSNIFKVYNSLYTKGLLDKDFHKKSRKDLRMDFYNKKVAMYISTFEDKGYFSNIMPLNFDVGISDLPKFDEVHNNKQYFLSNSNFLTINKNISNKESKEQKYIKYVFNWLVSERTNREILSTRMSISPTIKNTTIKNDIYKEYNDISNFNTEVKDPSIYISRDSKKTIDLSIDAIKGKKSIDGIIKELNNNYKGYCDFTKENRKIKLQFFK